MSAAKKVALLDAALYYAKLGYGVFPCKARGKVPAGMLAPNGLHDATTDPARIAAWWRPGATLNIGIVPPPDCFVVDVDDYKPGVAEAVAPLLARLLALRTPRQRSGGGGLHFVLRGDPPTTKQLRDAWGLTTGIEVKEHGKGYVIAAPSVHPDSGKAYDWEVTPKTAIAHANNLYPDGYKPLTSRDATQPPAKKPRLGISVAEIERMMKFIPDHYFDEYDNWLPLLAAIHHETEGSDEGLELAERLTRPGNYTAADKWSTFGSYDGHEATIHRLVSHAKCEGYKLPRSIEPALAEFYAAERRAERRLSIRDADTIEMQNVTWLWRGWLPRKFITVAAADSGSGKTTVTGAITACLTAALPWPNESKLYGRSASHVLWLGVEDPHAELTVPRLSAAGANLKLVHFIDGVEARGSMTAFSLQDDLDLLRQELKRRRDLGEDVSTIVVDPVTNYLHGKKRINPHVATELREVLTPFAVLAEEEDVAVICITHLTKDKARGFIDSVLGSGALVQIARLCIGFGAVPGEEDTTGDFAMFWGKGNLAAQPPAIRYRVVQTSVTEHRTGEIITTSKVEWGDEDPTINVREMVGQARGPVAAKKHEAVAWLRERLGDEEWHAAENVRLQGLAAGHSAATLRRATEAICEKEQRSAGRWEWRLKSKSDT